MSKRAVSAEDIFRIRLLGEVAMHPDGSAIAATVTELDREENSYRTHIWRIEAESGEMRVFANGSKSDSKPRWSPDGRWLAFLSNRSTEHQQLYVMPADGGEAVRVTAFPDGVEAFQWAPDSRRVALTTRVDLNKGPRVDWGAEDRRESPREKFSKDVLRIRKSFYRLDGVGFFGDKRAHLHVVDLAALATSSAVAGTDQAIRQQFPYACLTFGDFHVDSFDWAPDGQSLAMAANPREDAERTFAQYLYRVPVPQTLEGAAPVATEDLVCLTGEFHWAGALKWSPDGRRIAFRGHNRQHGPTTMAGLYALDVESGRIQWLTEGIDEVFENSSLTDTRGSVRDELAWSPDGSAVYSLMSRRGTVQLVAVDATTGALRHVTDGAHCVLDFSLDRAGERMALHVGTSLDVGNVYLLDGALSTNAAGVNGAADRPTDSAHPYATGAGRRLTDLNRAYLDEVELAVPQKFHFESDGLTLDGWAILPPAPAPVGGYPVVLEVHGGPAAMYAESFFLEFQLLAASGMAVVYTNPRGGLGYGQEFVSCIEMDWGNLDFRDVEAGIEAALARFPLNPSEVAIAGGSYGGFMSAWAIGHSKRYKAAVVMRAVINWYSMMASDVGFVTPAEEFRGPAPWEDPDRYMRISPITYVNHIEAHTLIIHSENDYRCPIDQGEQLYIALRLRGVPVEFLRFPDESHGLSRNGQPWHRVVRLEAIQSFLAKELGTGQGATAE
ncbi:MAG: S9 family peptidase [Alicyclobacillus sp.]|nr:S9 family peptidase [Alicyclobacillus sp.]